MHPQHLSAGTPALTPLVIPRKKATIIVAYNEDRVIGRGGGIPWHIPDDLKRFKEITSGNSVIMGLNTYRSLPTHNRPLFNRFNFVISRSKSVQPNNSDGPFYCMSLDDAFTKSKNRIFVIGGEKIYCLALKEDRVEKIIATEVKGKHTGDTYFPKLDDSWAEKVIASHKDFVIKEFEKVSKELEEKTILSSAESSSPIITL